MILSDWQVDAVSVENENSPSKYSLLSDERKHEGSYASWATNIHVIMFVTFAVSISIGCAFYSLFHGWEVSTAFYYSSQVLLGNMYNIPEELDSYSEAFTMIFFLWGTGLIACCHLIATNFATDIIQENSSAKASHAVGGNDVNAPGFIVRVFRSVGLLRLLRSRGVFRIRIFCVFLAVIWIFLGAFYGIFVEQWSYLHSFYFAIGAMSAAGVPNPPCENGDDQYPSATCSLGTVRGFALGFYLIVGVPLFAFTVGLMSGLVVDSVAEADYRRIRSNESFSRLSTSNNNHHPVSTSPSTGHCSQCSAAVASRNWCRRNYGASSMCVASPIDQPTTPADCILAELLRVGKICNSDILDIRCQLFDKLSQRCCIRNGSPCVCFDSSKSANTTIGMRDIESSNSSYLTKDPSESMARCSRSWWCRKRVLSTLLLLLAMIVLLVQRSEIVKTRRTFDFPKTQNQFATISTSVAVKSIIDLTHHENVTAAASSSDTSQYIAMEIIDAGSNGMQN